MSLFHPNIMRDTHNPNPDWRALKCEFRRIYYYQDPRINLQPTFLCYVMSGNGFKARKNKTQARLGKCHW